MAASFHILFSSSHINHDTTGRYIFWKKGQIINKKSYWKYRMCQEKSFTIQENIPYLKLHPYNQRYTHDNFNIYRYNKASKMWSYCGSTYYRLV